MKRRGFRAVAVVLMMVLVATMGAGCQPQAAKAEPAGGSNPSEIKVRTVADREDALAGKVVTPADFGSDFFPGIEKPGAIPAKKFFIAFSNGEMGNGWCRTHVNDMVDIADKYNKEFGVRFEWTNAGNNSTKQLSDIQSLIAKKPDLLLVNPNEAEPLSVIVDWCNKANIPLITIDKQLSAPTGEGMYISCITMDGYLNGVANGVAIVKTLTEKYGEPKGNVGELAGILGASTSKYRSLGLNAVLKGYPNIKITVSRPGEWDPKVSYAAAQDILTTFPAGSLDVIASSCDESGLSFMEASKAANRTELDGYYTGCDGTVAFLQKILDGKAIETNEWTPYFAIPSFEYAIHYLNGNSIPPIVAFPQRDYSADTPEKKAKLQEFVTKCKEQKLDFVPLTFGGHDLFKPDPEIMSKFYTPGDIFVNKEKYTTGVQPYVISQ